MTEYEYACAESELLSDDESDTVSHATIDSNLSDNSYYYTVTQDNIVWETDRNGNLNIEPLEITITWDNPFADRLFDQLREIEIDKNWDRTKHRELKTLILNSISEKLNKFIEFEDIDDFNILKIEIRFSEVFIKFNVLRNGEYEEYYRNYPHISINYGLR